MKISNSLLLSILLLFSSIAYTNELLSTTTTWEGEQIVYPEGEAQITSVLLKIAEGEVTPFHCHPVPTLGYILKGRIEVETQSGESSVFREGESVVEVLGTLHRGKALGGPVEIVVFYAGSTSVPNTVLPGDDADSKFCKP
jgi:quercetin dioxygenase-like cupin family protein